MILAVGPAQNAVNGINLLHLIDTQVEVGLSVGWGLETGVGHPHSHRHVDKAGDLQG